MSGFGVAAGTSLTTLLTAVTLPLPSLLQALASFDKENTSRKHLCLQYLVPWLPNLTDYTAVARSVSVLSTFDGADIRS